MGAGAERDVTIQFAIKDDVVGSIEHGWVTVGCRERNSTRRPSLTGHPATSVSDVAMRPIVTGAKDRTNSSIAVDHNSGSVHNRFAS